jgi:hypothetical protein
MRRIGRKAKPALKVGAEVTWDEGRHRGIIAKIGDPVVVRETLWLSSQTLDVALRPEALTLVFKQGGRA